MHTPQQLRLRVWNARCKAVLSQHGPSCFMVFSFDSDLTRWLECPSPSRLDYMHGKGCLPSRTSLNHPIPLPHSTTAPSRRCICFMASAGWKAPSHLGSTTVGERSLGKPHKSRRPICLMAFASGQAAAACTPFVEFFRPEGAVGGTPTSWRCRGCSRSNVLQQVNPAMFMPHLRAHRRECVAQPCDSGVILCGNPEPCL